MDEQGTVEERGPTLGRPFVDMVKHFRHPKRRNFRILRECLEKRLEADPGPREGYETERQAMHDALSLAAVHEQVGVTQVELAGALHVSQGNVSQLERKQDLYLSTLTRYVEALGGRLEMHVVFPDRALRIRVGGEAPPAG
jgi:predicted XRE-type DNA-binding protein